MLFDIGIEDMILGIDDFERPTEYDASSSLPTGATVNIVGGSTSSPAMCYGFTLGSGDSLLMPDSVDWAQPPAPCTVFFNTGRRALASYDYLYDATCGNVGFEPLSSPLEPHRLHESVTVGRLRCRLTTGRLRTIPQAVNLRPTILRVRSKSIENPSQTVPRVSVMIPAYNAAATIAGTVESVIAQTIQDFEIICVDDGSTDATLAIVKKFGDRVRLIEQANSGPAAARNNGARHSSGEYLAFLDADDVWMPQFLERSVAALDGDHSMSLAYCNCALADSEGVPIDTSLVGNGFDHAPSLNEC